MKRFLLSILVLAAMAVPVYGDLDAARRAWRAGDVATATKIWTDLAIQGDARAQHRLGHVARTGRGGVAVDKAAALGWFRAAADQGHRGAQVKLAEMLRNGEAGPAAPVEAAGWAARAAAQGDETALHMLGAMHRVGEGVARDLVKSWVFFALAERHGHVTAGYDRLRVQRALSRAERHRAESQAASWTMAAGPGAEG